MGMSIVKSLEVTREVLKCEQPKRPTTSYGIMKKESLAVAIEVINKYQQIDQIISDGYLQGKSSGEMLLGIKEIMNGNDD